MHTKNRYSCDLPSQPGSCKPAISRLAVGGFIGIALSCFPLLLAAQAADDREVLTPPVTWQNRVKPPVLLDPIKIQLNAETPTKWVPDFDRVGCEGLIYEFYLPADRDAIVTMNANMGALRYPLWVTGGRNVQVVGLEFRTDVQPGCGIGEAHQVRSPNPNIHPRLVGGKVMRLQQSATTYLEGIDIDLMGQEADCFVSRNTAHMSPEMIKSDRAIVIVNSRCTGIEGLSHSPIGDGLHGDFFQNQGEDDIGSLTLENVTFKTSSNGITLHSWNGSRGRPALLELVNVDYSWDERYSADSRYEISGLMFTGSADNVRFENVWMNDGRGERFNYGFVNGQRVGAYSRSGYVTKNDGLLSGLPPLGEFAPAEQTGLEYQ